MSFEFQIPLEIDVKIEGEQGVTTEKTVEDIIMTAKSGVHKVFAPVQVVVDNKHAEFIEFGSMPALGNKKPWPEFVEIIEEWTKAKLHLTGKKANSTAYAIATHILRDGIPPQPFFRPAIFETMSKYLPDGADWDTLEIESFWELAEKLKESILRIYAENNTPYGGPYLDSSDHPIGDSVTIRTSKQSWKALSNVFEEDTSIPEYLWRTDKLGKDNRPAAHYGNR